MLFGDDFIEKNTKNKKQKQKKHSTFKHLLGHISTMEAL